MNINKLDKFGIISIKVKQSNEWAEFHKSEDPRIIDATVQSLKQNELVEHIKVDFYQITYLITEDIK